MNRNERHDIPRTTTNSTSDWVWLRDALDLAAAALGSRALAKGRLTEWLAAGKLPWSCMSWEGLDAAAIARLRQELTVAGIMSVAPSAPYYNGDPKFWGTSLVEIDWGDNAAYETVFVIDGARARGMERPPAAASLRLSRGPRERKQWRGAGAWIAAEASRMKAANEIPPDIRITDFARELARRMDKAATSDRSFRPIKSRSIEKKLRDWALWPTYLHQIAEAHIGRTNVRLAYASCETGTARKREGTAALGAEGGSGDNVGSYWNAASPGAQT